MQSQQDGEAPRPDLVQGVTAIEKAAQGGHGFQTVGVDLGVLGSRNNVDDEIRQQTSSSGGVAGSSRTSSSYDSHYSTGSRQAGSASSGQGHTYSSHGGSNYQQAANSDEHANDYEDEEEYDGGYDDQNQSGGGRQGGGGSQWSRSSSYAYSHKRPLNADPGSIDQRFKHYPSKRDVSKQSIEDICQRTQCLNVRCVVGPLDKNTVALVALRTRLVAHTLHKVS